MKFNAGQQYENPPAGSHIARCYSLIDLGTQIHPGFQGGPERASRDVRISFELPTEKMEGIYNPESKGKPFSVHLNCKQSLHLKSRLTAMLEGWRGKKFDKESVSSFDPKNLIGKPCRVALIENGDYINIDAISPLSKTDKCPKQVNASVYFSLDPEEFDRAVFDKLGERTREKIQKSPEWAALNSSAPGEEPQGDAPDQPQSDAGGEPF